MSQELSQGVYLPRCVAKFELIAYFGCDYKFLWSRLIPDELLHQWGYDSDQVKKCRRLDTDLTRLIYLHHRITDLNSDYSEEIAALLEENTIRSR